MSTAAAGADSTGEGATQIKFVTRSGTNQFHGGLFETNRNSYFEANYYFNGINGLKRDFLNLNEYGYRIGGPIKKNKLFFFNTYEFFFLPQSFLTSGQTWLTRAAGNGVFTYKDSGGGPRRQSLHAGRGGRLPEHTGSLAGEDLFAHSATHRERRHPLQPDPHE